MQENEAFTRQVGHALAHLYDPIILRAHPLVATFGLFNCPNARTELRELLLKGIEQLRPDPAEPIYSRSWRVYKLLQLRYSQQLGQEQTAYQLGVGVRHLRREQKAAIQILADLLAQLYNLSEAAPATVALPLDELLANVQAWLNTATQENSVNAAVIFQAAIQLVTRSAVAHKVKSNSAAFSKLPAVTVDPVGLRQALAIPIISAIKRVPTGQIRYAAGENGKKVLPTVTALAQRKLVTETTDTGAELKAARTILNACGLSLEISEQKRTLSLTIHLPISERVKICLFDDNADTVQLFEHYLVGTPYQLSSQRNAEQLIGWIEQHHPQVIILDVMMPEVDGWEILGQLKQHPLTHALPIIICSVLPERDLALMLGAAIYLPKPVTRSKLLAALNQIFHGGSSAHR